jgi:hypothetical protein
VSRKALAMPKVVVLVEVYGKRVEAVLVRTMSVLLVEWKCKSQFGVPPIQNQND